MEFSFPYSFQEINPMGKNKILHCASVFIWREVWWAGESVIIVILKSIKEPDF